METAINVMWEITLFLDIFIYFFGFVTIYRLIYVAIALVSKGKKFKPTTQKYKYAVLIPARNEEKVIGQLIDSINKQDYIKDDKSLITIFVVADNCSDKTAEIAREHGAVVYERINPPKNRRRKGWAMEFLVENVRKDYGIETFDGYLIMDADNLLSKNYMTKMNDAFDNKEFDMFTSYVESKNFGTTLMSSFVSMVFYEGMRESRALSVLGLGVMSNGKGALMRNNIFQKINFKWCGFSDDYEYSLDFASRGVRTTFVKDAICFDEQPLTYKDAARQRRRWGRGTLLAWFKYLPPLCLGIFAPYDFDKYYARPRPTQRNILKRAIIGFKKRLTCLNMLIFVSPIWITSFLILILYPTSCFLFKSINPDYDLTPMYISLIFYLAAHFVSAYVYSAITVICEHRRMRIPPAKLFFYFLIWPFLQIIFNWIFFFALFGRVRWKRMPHVVDHKIEDIYDTPTLNEAL
ncbi:MAG: glycosyltransferase family 2 protein [Christensenellaceae bacterium]|jgi:cellulose synthase/poly-beta-1,6-N-acetylglucosamine synthase-like glycosyltransferase|nr:glycosyltransferase family 2 protein [Christensenellaceae bacterium]